MTDSTDNQLEFQLSLICEEVLQQTSISATSPKKDTKDDNINQANDTSPMKPSQSQKYEYDTIDEQPETMLHTDFADDGSDVDDTIKQPHMNMTHRENTTPIDIPSTALTKSLSTPDQSFSKHHNPSSAETSNTFVVKHGSGTTLQHNDRGEIEMSKSATSSSRQDSVPSDINNDGAHAHRANVSMVNGIAVAAGDDIDDEESAELNDSDNDHIRTKSLPRFDANDATRTVQNYIENKWMKLFTNCLFWSRIVILLFSLFVLTLCCLYSIAQLVTVELNIVTECDGQRTREEIWEHSYKAGQKNGGILDANAYESMYGWTFDECWSTNRIEINTRRLWYSNYYSAVWTDGRDGDAIGKCIGFGIAGLYCLAIIMYSLCTLIIDVVSIKNNKLHTMNKAYKALINQTNNIHSGLNKTLQKESVWKNKYRCLREFYDKYLGTDTVGWVARMYLSECIEIVLQTNALLLYNGYNASPGNDDTVYLAMKPEFIKLFAAFIMFNCIGSGITWTLYACNPKFCNGLKFKMLIFIMDQCADVLYSIFPFIAIIYDEYNDQNRTSFEISLGQLNTESTLAFFAAWVPLVWLCNKCLMIAYNSRKQMKEACYKKWLFVNHVQAF